jgi:hypothetical protein
MVKAEINLNYDIDGWDALEEDRSLLLISITKGQPEDAISVLGNVDGLLRAIKNYS